MACSADGANRWLSTWGDLQSCHDSSIANGDTISIIPDTYSVVAQTVISKHVIIVADTGVVELVDNFGTSNTVGTSDSMLYIIGSNDGVTKFGGPNFRLTMGSSRHTNPSAVIYVGDFGTYPVVLLGMSNPGCGTNCFGGNLIHIQGYRGVVRGFSIEAWLGGSSNCINNAGFVRSHGNSTATGWKEVSKFGDADTDGLYQIYVEDNTFVNINECIDLNDGSRMVIRHNDFTNSAIVHHGADTQTYGGRYSEIYNNSFQHDPTGVGAPTTCSGLYFNGNGHIGFRGGTSIVVNNFISEYFNVGWGDKSPIQAVVENIWRAGNPLQVPWECWGTINNDYGFAGYPNPFQCGWGWSGGGTFAGNATDSNYGGAAVKLDLEPMIFAANTGNGNFTALSVQDATTNDCGSSETTAGDYVIEYTEYFNQKSATAQSNATTPFDGSNGGSGYGTWVNRPTSCTDGRYYWATDQGAAWDNGAVGGALYKCASNNWNLFYTPYTYPHPLVAGSGSPPTGSRRVKVHPPHRTKRS